MATTYLKQHDTKPLEATLTQKGGRPIDLSGATVKFLMKQNPPGSTTITGTCTLVNATKGIVRYSWGGSDLNTPGTYKVEFEITFADTKKQTVPSKDYEDVVVTADLG